MNVSFLFIFYLKRKKVITFYVFVSGSKENNMGTTDYIIMQANLPLIIRIVDPCDSIEWVHITVSPSGLRKVVS